MFLSLIALRLNNMTTKRIKKKWRSGGDWSKRSPKRRWLNSYRAKRIRVKTRNGWVQPKNEFEWFTIEPISIPCTLEDFEQGCKKSGLDK